MDRERGDAGGGGGRGVGNQLWTGLDRGTEVPKIPKFVWTSFKDDPFMIVRKYESKNLILLEYTTMTSLSPLERGKIKVYSHRLFPFQLN